MDFNIDPRIMQALVGQYQAPYTLPTAIPQAQPPSMVPPANAGPTMQNLGLVGSPTADAAQNIGTTGNTGNKPPKSTMMDWDAMLSALSAGMATRPPQAYGSHLAPVSVGGGKQIAAPLFLYGPTVYKSLLASMLKGMR